MGVNKLMSFLKERVPNAISKGRLKDYKGKTVAIDAAMALYEFTIAMMIYNKDSIFTELTDSEGNQTAHLLGMLNRTTLFLQNGIKPVWVFDGTAPSEKFEELKRRKQAKMQASEEFQKASDEGETEKAYKFKVRTVSITRKMKQDAFDMLTLLGVPTLRARGEAEAQCAYLTRSNFSDAVYTEDMDALAFGSPRVIRRPKGSKTNEIIQLELSQILMGLDITYEQFVDFCILCGCDYTTTIPGIGPARAFTLIKDHKTIEEAIKVLTDVSSSPKKKPKEIPQDFDFVTARKLFITPSVEETIDPSTLKVKEPEEEKLTTFLVEQKKFSYDRVTKAIDLTRIYLQSQA